MSTEAREREVLIVGGGLAAGLIARKLVPHGHDVLVLERGPDRTGGPATTIPSQRDELRWAIHRGMTRPENVETYTHRHQLDGTSRPMRQLVAFLPGYGVGGAAQHWNGATWRFSEADFSLRSHLTERYGKQSIPEWMAIQDWGIGYSDLQPYYEEFEQLFGISGKAGNIKGKRQAGGNPFESWRERDYPLAPLESCEAGLIFKQAAEKLGYSPFPIPAANASQPYTNPDGRLLGACQYCGHCERFTCEANAKATPSSLLYPLVFGKPNFELRSNTEVIRVLTDSEGQRVTGVSCIDTATGAAFEQRARVIILAAYTLSNTRLLLGSGLGEPYNPVTMEGVVGKNYCHQVVTVMSLFFKNRYMNPFMGAGALGHAIDDFNNDNFDHTDLGFHGGGYIAAGTTSGRPIAARRVPPATPRWGTAWKQANAEWYLKSMSLVALGANYAHRGHFMDLDSEYKDSWGEPLLRITFDFDENDSRMSEFLNGKMVEIAAVTGADITSRPVPRTSPFDTRQYHTTHNTGGTIMGADPVNSVVSPHLQSWRAENLFIVGSSVFPQNSGYNPTGTVAALSMRLADDLLSYLKDPRRLG